MPRLLLALALVTCSLSPAFAQRDAGAKARGDFFEKVDNMMYGYGRAPIVEGGRVSGYRLLDPEMVQDPVVFVPLDEADLAKLREILRLSPDAPLPRWLDVG